MPDIEFLTGETADPGEDDVLDIGPRRRLPRWAIWTGAAVAAAGLAVAVTVFSVEGGSGSSDQPPPAPAPTQHDGSFHEPYGDGYFS